MKKKMTLGLAGIMILALLGGCGKAKSEYLIDDDYTKYVTLCDYKGIEADRVVFEITDEDVKNEIEDRMYEYATYNEITDRAVQVGDYVVISSKAKLDGKESEDYSSEEEEVAVGEGYYYPEVEDALVGMNAGDSKTVNVELTEDFADEEDIGKKLEMDINVISISEEIIPECTEEFVKEETDYKSVKDFEKSVREELEEEKKDEYEGVSSQTIMSYIMDNSKFNGYPDKLYEQCKADTEAEYEYYAAMFGMEYDDFKEQMGLDEDTMKEEIESAVNYELVIGAIAQLEGIKCGEKDVNKYVKENYEQFGFESEEEFLEQYSKEEIGRNLLYEKVMDFLLANAKYNDIDEAKYLEQQAAEQMDFEGEDDEISIDEEDEPEEADNVEEPEE